MNELFSDERYFAWATIWVSLGFRRQRLCRTASKQDTWRERKKRSERRSKTLLLLAPPPKTIRSLLPKKTHFRHLQFCVKFTSFGAVSVLTSRLVRWCYTYDSVHCVYCVSSFARKVTVVFYEWRWWERERAITHALSFAHLSPSLSLFLSYSIHIESLVEWTVSMSHSQSLSFSLLVRALRRE